VYIVAKADSKLTKDDAFIGLNLGMVKSDVLGNNFGIEILKNNNKTGYKAIEYKNYDESYKDLMSGKTDIMIVSTYGLSDLFDKYGDKYNSSIKIILQDSKKMSLIENKPVDINSNGFTILVSGVDLTSKNINEKGSSDVNILVSINPNTKRVVMQVVPRDMWTKLACASGHSKLTYAGAWGGVDCSIKSLEDYFDIDINYYAKINFKGVTDLVDALGGIDVISDYEYCESGYCFKLGENHLDGDYALMFARIRHVLPGGDLARGKHQMEIINAVIKKFGANPSYDNLTSLLSTVENNFTTNFKKEDILKMYNLYTELAPTLKIESYSIAGHTENAIDECTTEQLYYFYPDAGEKERVNKLIHDVVEGK
ncbi:MAG: LCP family protein, partial [Erysipelotrichaceae bacterium]